MLSHASLLHYWLLIFFTWIFAEVTSKYWQSSPCKPAVTFMWHPALWFSLQSMCKCGCFVFYNYLLPEPDITGMSTQLSVSLLYEALLSLCPNADILPAFLEKYESRMPTAFSLYIRVCRPDQQCLSSRWVQNLLLKQEYKRCDQACSLARCP